MQVSIGFVLPALISVVREACLFQQHQRQRRQAGLPPERGWQAAAYAWMAAAWEPFDSDAVLLLSLAAGLPCLLWQIALMLAGVQSVVPAGSPG